MVDRHSGIYQGTGRCRCSHSTGAITAACNVQIERSRCTETSADAEHLYLITYTMLPEPEDIEDPHGKEYAKFRTAAEQTNKALRTILTSMRKHYRVEEAPVRPQITRQYAYTV